MNKKRNDQLGRTNSPWSAALKVLCTIMAITGSAWPNQAGSIRPDFDTWAPSSSVRSPCCTLVFDVNYFCR